MLLKRVKRVPLLDLRQQVRAARGLYAQAKPPTAPRLGRAGILGPSFLKPFIDLSVVISEARTVPTIPCRGEGSPTVLKERSVVVFFFERERE